MKKLAKIILTVIFASLTVFMFALAAFAATSQNGWITDENGVERYYKNGSFVTGRQRIGEHTYIFGDDGAFVRMVDDFRNVGTYGVMDTQAYKDAISALGNKVYLNFPITTQNIESSRNIYDGLELYEETSNIRYVYNSGNTKTKFGIALNDSSAKFISKGNGDNGNLAVQTWQSTSGTNPYVNLYADTEALKAAEDVVAEVEIKLGDTLSGTEGMTTLFQFIDRGHNGTSNVLFAGVLSYTTAGAVFAKNYSTTKCVAHLTQESYTRISVAIHPIENTYDVYVNGILVVEGVTFIVSPASWYNAENFKPEELRIAYYGGATEDRNESFCIDNVYMYAASKPVCTETAEPRNGVYAGENTAYLRNYVDNLLVGGSVELNGIYFGHSFEKEAVLFDQQGKYFIGNTAFLKVDGQVKKSETVKENVFVAPSPSGASEGKSFIGWRATDMNGNSRFMRVGDNLRIDGDITYEPVVLFYDMLDGASVKTDKASTGLRYIARISKSDYDMLVSLGFKIEAHILTMPTEYIEKTYGYTTLDALQDLDQIVYSEWNDSKSEGWYHETENFYYYTASVTNIAPDSFMKDYSASGYLKITYPDGEVEYIYTDYSEENNARNVYEVATKAYNDRTLKKEKKLNYTVKVDFKGMKTYSPYDTERLGAVKSFVDKIINLKADNQGVTPTGEYYEPPYKLDIEDAFGEYNITVKDNGDWLLENAVAFILNGKLISNELSGGEYSYMLEYEGTYIKTDNVAGGGVDDEDLGVNKWYLIDAQAHSDRNYFPIGNQSFPAKAPNGESSGFVWDFTFEGQRQGIDFYDGASNAKLGWSMDEDGNSVDSWYTAKKGTKTNKYVLDMSDWQNMEFWVYVDEKYVGSEFIILFYSSNPDTVGNNGKDDPDYYSYTIKLNNAGWNKVYLSKKDAKLSRFPLGWDNITGVKVINTGWSLENSNGDYGQRLYLTSIVFDDNEAIAGTLAGEERLNGAAAFYPNGYASVINRRLYVTDADDHKITTFKEGDTYYLPALSLAKALGYSAKWYEVGSVIAVELEDGYEYRLAPGKKYSQNGEVLEYEKEAKVKGGNLFISAEDAMAIFGYSEVYVDRMDVIVLSNTKNIFDPVADYNVLYEIIEECNYVRPTGEQIYQDLMVHSGGVHPYLMLNQADFDRLNYYKKKDVTLSGYITTLAKSYDVDSKIYRSAPVVYEIKDGTRLLPVSREAKERTRCFALLYKLYEFDNHEKAVLLAERLWKELEAVCNFPDWNPSHYLDTAEMAYGVAIGYDWLYDYWKKYDDENGTDRLGIMEKAMYEHSLKTTSALSGGTYSYILSSSTNNWNGVCNGGTMAAALALVTNPTYRDDAITVIGASIIGIESGMRAYAPDGGYEEGPVYWAYGTTYVSVFISSLDSACGTDYGLYNTPGFAHSAYFTTYLGTMNTTWDFHDSGRGAGNTDIAAWFAKKSSDGNINAIRRQAIENGWKSSGWYDIIWFLPHVINDTVTLELDAYYSLDTVITFRDSWDKKNSVFVGFHGGDNGASHGDLDIGNFVISINGVHMIGELGPDEYNIAGYFGIYRWSYYRKRAEGQNTLVMLPHGDSWAGKTGIPKADPVTNKVGTGDEPVPDQNKDAVSKCLRYETSSDSALAVINMSPAYKDYVSEDNGAIRGVWFKDDRSTIIIQDEGYYTESMDIWWFAHTEGVITVSKDGRSAIIERSGIYLYAELVTNIENARFYVSEAVSLDPDYVGDTERSDYLADDYEKSRDGITKLCIKAENVTEYKMAVVFKVIPGMYNAPEIGTTYVWTDIKDWKIG